MALPDTPDDESHDRSPRAGEGRFANRSHDLHADAVRPRQREPPGPWAELVAESAAAAAPPAECAERQADQRERSRFRHTTDRRRATRRSRVGGAEIDRRILYADRETVPVFVAQTAPAHGVERPLELQHAMRLAGAQQLILGAHDLLVRGSAPPVTACVAVAGIAEAEDVEVPVESITVAVQTHVGEDRVGDRLRKCQGLLPLLVQGDDVGGGRPVVNRTARVGRRSAGTVRTVAVIVDAAARLIEGDPLRVRVGHADRRAASGDRALGLEAGAGIEVAAGPVGPEDRGRRGAARAQGDGQQHGLAQRRYSRFHVVLREIKKSFFARHNKSKSHARTLSDQSTPFISVTCISRAQNEGLHHRLPVKFSDIEMAEESGGAERIRRAGNGPMSPPATRARVTTMADRLQCRRGLTDTRQTQGHR